MSVVMSANPVQSHAAQRHESSHRTRGDSTRSLPPAQPSGPPVAEVGAVGGGCAGRRGRGGRSTLRDVGTALRSRRWLVVWPITAIGEDTVQRRGDAASGTAPSLWTGWLGDADDLGDDEVPVLVGVGVLEGPYDRQAGAPGDDRVQRDRTRRVVGDRTGHAEALP